MKINFDKINTGLTIISIIWAVSNFMIDVFNKYEKKHGKNDDKG